MAPRFENGRMVYAPTLMLGAVLTGGQSSRMGSDKALLCGPDGRTLLDIGAWSFADVCPAVAICAPAGRYPEPTQDIGRRLAILNVPDLRSDCGPIGGVEAALLWAAHHGATWLMTRPVDMPLLPAAWLAELVQRAVDKGHKAAFIGDSPHDGHPLCAAWLTSLAPQISAWLDGGGRSAFKLHAHLGSLAVPVAALGAVQHNPRALLNINTPDDLAKLNADG